MAEPSTQKQTRMSTYLLFNHSLEVSAVCCSRNDIDKLIQVLEAHREFLPATVDDPAPPDEAPAP